MKPRLLGHDVRCATPPGAGPSRAAVLREGERLTVVGAEIVPGNIVLLDRLIITSRSPRPATTPGAARTAPDHCPCQLSRARPGCATLTSSARRGLTVVPLEVSLLDADAACRFSPIDNQGISLMAPFATAKLAPLLHKAANCLQCGLSARYSMSAFKKLHRRSLRPTWGREDVVDATCDEGPLSGLIASFVVVAAEVCSGSTRIGRKGSIK